MVTYFVNTTLALGGRAQAGAETGSAGVVKGTITFEGSIPVHNIPDGAGAYRNLIEVDSATRGLRDAVVVLRPQDEKDWERFRHPGAVLPKKAVLIDQLGDRFVPHVLAVRAGQTVTFSNSDLANHNVRTVASRAENQFNIFVGSGGTYRHVLRGEPRPIQLGCDIHPWMSGWIYVFDHPYYAVTDEQGRFEIPSVPPGKYKASIAQPDLKYRSEQEFEVKPGATVAVTLTIKKPAKE